MEDCAVEATCYLADLAAFQHDLRNCNFCLRDQAELDKSRVSTCISEQSFHYAAPNIWNRLPADVFLSPSLTVFKSRLKTHYF